MRRGSRDRLSRACGRAGASQGRYHRGSQEGTCRSRRPRMRPRRFPSLWWARSNDPVEAGFVESLARPGGNVTGVSNLSRELGGEAAGAAQRSRSQTCPCRGSLRSGHSGQCTRGERDSPSRGACAGVDSSALGGTSCGRFR